MNLALKSLPIPSRATDYLGPARVTACTSTGPRVELRDGRTVDAELALALPYEPAIGDRLLVIGDGDEHWVIGIIHGSGRTSLELQGDVELSAVGGALKLRGEKGVSIVGPEIEVRATTLRTFAETAFEKMGTVYRRVSGRLQRPREGSAHRRRGQLDAHGEERDDPHRGDDDHQRQRDSPRLRRRTAKPMLPASNKGVGENIGFPDVCLTPPLGVPVPYPNIAMNAMAAPFAATVMVSGMNALNLASMIPMTMGDQAGSMSPIMGPGRYTMGNPVVSIEALPAINLLCPTTGNNMNNPLGAVLVPSVTNVFYTCVAPRPLEGAAIRSEVLDGDVLRLAIRAFTGSVGAEVHAAIEGNRGAFTTLWIDLRGNPGGELRAFVDLASDFLEHGSLIVRVVDADGDETAYYARSEHPHAFPVVVEVDGDTASAAELFAGCMQAHGRARIVGGPTHGKVTAHLATSGAGYPIVGRCILPERAFALHTFEVAL